VGVFSFLAIGNVLLCVVVDQFFFFDDWGLVGYFSHTSVLAWTVGEK